MKLLRKPKPSTKAQQLIQALSTSNEGERPIARNQLTIKTVNKLINAKPVVKIRTQLSKLPKRLRRAVYLFLVLSIGFTGTGLFYLFNPWTTKTAEAAWFNDNWAYRKTISFTHDTTVSSATKVKFDIDTTDAPDKFQSDCGDVRFTSPNGDILPYYYDAGNGACDTSSTDFYVLIPSIINGSNYIYMYYGNPTVTNGTRAANFPESTTTPSGTPSVGSEEKSPSPVAYWKFDEGQGTTAEDGSTNALDSTLSNGPTYKTEDFCIAGKCLFFDGSNDGVNRADDAKLDFAATDSFSISMWIKSTSPTNPSNDE